jgi:FtsZ-binding cell division protein ZapB
MDSKEFWSGLAIFLSAVIPVMGTVMGAILARVYKLGQEVGELKAENVTCRRENAGLHKKVAELERRLNHVQRNPRKTDLRIDPDSPEDE